MGTFGALGGNTQVSRGFGVAQGAHRVPSTGVLRGHLVPKQGPVPRRGARSQGSCGEHRRELGGTWGCKGLAPWGGRRVWHGTCVLRASELTHARWCAQTGPASHEHRVHGCMACEQVCVRHAWPAQGVCAVHSAAWRVRHHVHSVWPVPGRASAIPCRPQQRGGPHLASVR